MRSVLGSRFDLSLKKGVKKVKTYSGSKQMGFLYFGILPLVFKHSDDYGKLGKGDLLAAENWRDRVSTGMPVSIVNRTGGGSMECTYSLSEKQKASVLVPRLKSPASDFGKVTS